MSPEAVAEISQAQKSDEISGKIIIEREGQGAFEEENINYNQLAYH